MILSTQAPETAAKLQPVCRALNIDKDDFTIRRVIAAYERSDKKSTHTATAAAPAESKLLSIHQCIHLSIYLSIYLSIRVSIYLSLSFYFSAQIILRHLTSHSLICLMFILCLPSTA